MYLSTFRESNRFRLFALAISIVFIASSVLPLTASAQAQVKSADEMLREVYVLRSQGEYERAVEALNGIFEEFSEADEVLRTVYNELVFTISLFDEPAATAKAREALEQFPDLRADPVRLGDWANETYDRLRTEMFGRLIIEKPEGCRVFLNGEHLGETPFDEQLVRVGEYELTLTKSGYKDYKEGISIEAGQQHNLAFSMNRYKGKRWWLYRVGPAVVAGAVLAVALIGGDEGSGPELLPGPPGPPSQ